MGSASRANSLGAKQVLDGDGHARQGRQVLSQGQAFVRLGCLLQGLIPGHGEMLKGEKAIQKNFEVIMREFFA